MCSLKCLENLTSGGNITESNSSSIYYNTTTGLEESMVLKGILGNSNNNGATAVGKVFDYIF